MKLSKAERESLRRAAAEAIIAEGVRWWDECGAGLADDDTVELTAGTIRALLRRAVCGDAT